MQSRIVFALVLAALVGVALSAPNMIPRVTMVRPTTLTHGWLEQGRSDPEARTQLVFAVKNDVEGVSILERYVKDISHPKSPRYGQWMSLEAVQRLTANPTGEEQVVQWLLSHRGVDESMLSVYENAGFIKVQNLPISVAEVLLESRFYEYRRTHHQTGKVEVAHRARSISIPAVLAPHVAFVAYSHVLPRQTGAHRFRSLTLAPPQGSKVGAASGSVTPQLLFQTYNIDNPVVDNIAASNSLFESLGQDFSPDDLTTYCQQNNIPNQQISQVVGPNTPSACGTNPDSCGEANLDVQVISAVAQNANTTYWSIPGDQEPFLPWLMAVASSSNPPLVHSVSYGDVESTTGTDVLGHFNTELLKLAARGVTVVVSSGDDGVANFIARSDPTQCGFNPAFPASSPYVVSVGATQGPEFGTPEIACASNTNGLITTGGGFSNYFGIPSYQANEISAFLNQPTLPPTNQFNTTGRGYPDVSLLGHNYNVVLGGQTYQESGTSASAPAFAALLTLINAARLDAGKSAVGFVNPAIYHIYETDPQVFNDITSGENNCCAGQPGQQTCCQYGFNAVSGWDGATGLGSVNFVGLKKAFLNL